MSDLQEAAAGSFLRTVMRIKGYRIDKRTGEYMKKDYKQFLIRRLITKQFRNWR